MFETTTEPLTLDIWRGNSMLPDADPAAWSIDFQTGLNDAKALCQKAEIPQLLHARAKIADICDINMAEGWCTIDPGKVELVELISLSPETYFRMVDQLIDREAGTHQDDA